MSKQHIDDFTFTVTQKSNKLKRGFYSVNYEQFNKSSGLVLRPQLNSTAVVLAVSTAVLSVRMLEDQSVLRVPPNSLHPPDSLKREMLLVELIEHFIPSSHPAESAASQRQRGGRGEIKERGGGREGERVEEGEREEEERDDGGRR